MSCRRDGLREVRVKARTALMLAYTCSAVRLRKLSQISHGTSAHRPHKLVYRFRSFQGCTCLAAYGHVAHVYMYMLGCVHGHVYTHILGLQWVSVSYPVLLGQKNSMCMQDMQV